MSEEALYVAREGGYWKLAQVSIPDSIPATLVGDPYEIKTSELERLISLKGRRKVGEILSKASLPPITVEYLANLQEAKPLDRAINYAEIIRQFEESAREQATIYGARAFSLEILHATTRERAQQVMKLDSILEYHPEKPHTETTFSAVATFFK